MALKKSFPDPRHVLDVVDDRRHIPAPHLLHGHLDAHLPGGNRRQPPQSSEQTSLKPVTEVYIDKDSKLFLVADRNDSTEENSTARAVTRDELLASLMLIQRQDSCVPWPSMPTARWPTPVSLKCSTSQHAIIFALCSPQEVRRNKNEKYR